MEGWVGQRAGVDALGKIQIFCSCLQASNHECLVVQPITESLYRLRYPDSCSVSSISTVLSVDMGVTMNEAFCWSVNGMWHIVPVLTRRRGVRVVIQIIVISNCQTGDDGVMYEKSAGYFSRG